MSDRQFSLALLGLAVLGAVGGGILMGQQASAEMAPFYANLTVAAPDDPQSNGVEVVSSDGSHAWVETADLSYRRATADYTNDSAY